MSIFDQAPPSRPALPTVEQASADEADLQASIAELSTLVSGALGLDALLQRVAATAAQAIPGADGAGVTLLQIDTEHNKVEALAASHPFVSQIDEIQYSVVEEGPCITAALERRTVHSGSLSGEKAWPRFWPRAGRLGVHSALSLPLILPGQLVGSINVYSYGEHVFGDHAAGIGESFAAPAAVAVHNAHTLARTLALAGQLQVALSTSPVIYQAIGLLRGRSGRTVEEEFNQMRVISQKEHTELAQVAQRVVDDAVSRAQARRSRTQATQP